jgi:hypothetical protein
MASFAASAARSEMQSCKVACGSVHDHHTLPSCIWNCHDCPVGTNFTIISRLRNARLITKKKFPHQPAGRSPPDTKTLSENTYARIKSFTFSTGVEVGASTNQTLLRLSATPPPHPHHQEPVCAMLDWLSSKAHTFDRQNNIMPA